jgi:RND family efflux transporter MFP subunit
MTRPQRFLAAVLMIGVAACRGARNAPPAGHAADETWQVTAWGESFEVFAETTPPIAGETAVSNAHVTVLSDFSPLRQGTVSLALRGGDRPDQVFRQDRPARDGIFRVEFRPESEGTFDMAFRIDSPAGSEEIAAGKVRVGSRESPGGSAGAAAANRRRPTEPIPFLKEQQWRTAFATAWVTPGSLRRSVSGIGKVRPVAGGEILLTAPVDGVVLADPWPYVGLEVRAGATVVRLTPRVGSDRSLAALEGARLELEAELQAARDRLGRLEDLLRLEAVSRAEFAAAQTRVATLEARLGAARRDLDTATVARRAGPGIAEQIDIRAPFGGRIAEVNATPGQAVAGGEPLARLVRTKPLWIEIALRPGDAGALTRDPAGLLLRTTGDTGPLLLPAGRVRLVSRSPEVDPSTGTVKAILQIQDGIERLRLGSTVDAEILLPQEQSGIVIPAAAVVDDGGVPIVYLQAAGESFVRQEIRILSRQGDAVLVEGPEPGDRLVARGGAAIRRAALLSSGPGEGHVH